MYIFLLFIIGLLIGSFLNVCIVRIPEGESISFPPSHCTNCGSRIKPYDLIPLLSYILLRGKCRVCGSGVSLQYPAVELLTGILFAALYFKYGLTFQLLKGAVFFCFLMVIGVIDLKTTDIYFKVTLSGILMGLVFTASGYLIDPFQNGIWDYLLGGIAGGSAIAVIILLTGGMGWGDAELCLLCGFYLGFPRTVVMLLFSFVIGAAIGLILVVTGRKSRKDMIPFGPFLAIGSVLSYFFGQELIQFYLTQFFNY